MIENHYNWTFSIMSSIAGNIDTIYIAPCRPTRGAFTCRHNRCVPRALRSWRPQII